MNYQQCLDFLFSRLPMYQKQGQNALKYDLRNINSLCDALDSPHKNFRSIHVAGTNGKGSSCHALASVLQAAGYKTGLYTSPHLKDYQERIKVNGSPVEPQIVVEFVESHQDLIQEINPSFFEITVALAFDHFSKQQVDIAVIEVGMGGRLDSTNIINPVISLITNIGFDHQAILGKTLTKIAEEKAGIIKPLVPVVLGETNPDSEAVFLCKANQVQAPIYFSHERYKIRVLESSPELRLQVYDNGELIFENLYMDLNGPYQTQNVPGVIQVLELLRMQNFQISDLHFQLGLSNIVASTGIKGRWQRLGSQPDIICDTGHNRAAMEFIVRHLMNISQGKLHMVMGFVNDKDIRSMLEILPPSADYYFCTAPVPRSMPAEELQRQAHDLGLKGVIVSDPNQALSAAREQASQEDTIFVGGSTFVVAALNEI